MKFIILIAMMLVIMAASAKGQRPAPCRQGARPPTCVGPRNVGTSCATNPPRRMWYYNQATRTCIAMDYLGCGGNSNRWCSLAACQRRCARP